MINSILDCNESILQNKTKNVEKQWNVTIPFSVWRVSNQLFILKWTEKKIISWQAKNQHNTKMNHLFEGSKASSRYSPLFSSYFPQLISFLFSLHQLFLFRQSIPKYSIYINIYIQIINYLLLFWSFVPLRFFLLLLLLLCHQDLTRIRWMDLSLFSSSYFGRSVGTVERFVRLGTKCCIRKEKKQHKNLVYSKMNERRDN